MVHPEGNICRCYSELVNGWTGDLPQFSGFFWAPQSNVHVLRA